MDQQEFNQKQDDLLNELPKEFQKFVSSYAWAQGHHAGYQEVLSYVQDLVSELKGPISVYTTRILEQNRG